VLGRAPEETARLIARARIVGLSTRRLFEDAGIIAGMKVLDVGSGAGDVALLAAELVGPTGAVVGIDTDAAILEVARRRVRAMGWANTTFVEGDVRTPFGEELFDAVVGRFVLFWVRDQVEVLRACAARLRPGGPLVFQEHDVLDPTWYRAYPPSQASAPHDRWGSHVLRQQGIDPAMANKLYGAYLEAGLPDPQLRYEAPLGGGPAWVGYEARADHARRLAPRIVEAGLATEAELATETLADRMREELVAQRGVLRCMPVVGIWARQPGPVHATASA
jgi:SAM-dependent methyltransferase